MLRRSTTLLLLALASATAALTTAGAIDTNGNSNNSGLDFSYVDPDNSTVGLARAADTDAQTSDDASANNPAAQNNNNAAQQSNGGAHVQHQIRSGALKSRGVNLGGWLVAEHWMTQDADYWRGVSADDANAGEYTAITQAKSPDTIRSNLAFHHANFINEEEIKKIAAAGLNTVRVPIGYWLPGFDNNDPKGLAEWKAFSANTLKYLDMLIRSWAKKHNVAVLVSIHAAKGSQNGADHSSPSVKGKAYWSEFKENVDNTHALALFLAKRYKSDDAFLGIGLLNEPNGATKEDVLYQYYEDAYKAIRATGNDCVLSVAPLLYKQGPDSMVGFMTGPTYTNVWVEWHPYFIWGYEQTSDSDLINVSVKKNLQGDVTKWNSRPNANRLFMGEWCFATSDRFKNNREMYYEWAAAQVNVLNQARGGWTFWSWRIYGDETGFNGWSLRSVLRDARFKQILLGGGGNDDASQQQQS